MEAFRTRRAQTYTFNLLRKDLVAGLTVGVIAIPLAMAFSIASGVRPEYGIYTTIVAGILISLCGGSKFQIGGPTGAFIPILFGIVMTYGYDNLLIAGFMAGVLLLLMGIFRLGSLISYMPRSVTIGFTTGIAVIIFSGQVTNFLGLSGVESHERFLDNMKEITVQSGTVNLYSVATAVLCLAVIVLIMKFWPKVPGSLIGLAVSSAVAALLYPQEVATIGSTYGMIPSSLPAMQVPEFTWDKIRLLLGPALMIAMLGGIESLLSATVADGMTGDRHRSNRELIGQGMANMATPLFGGIPATGAIARTATNIKSGAVSKLSGIIHGIVVLLVLLFFAPYASHIPLASMAPILMVVAWNMSERQRFIYILKMKSGDSFVMAVTFLTTVFVNLTAGVGIGLLLAFVLFTRQMSRISVAAEATRPPDNVPVSRYDVEGVLFFGAAQQFEQSLKNAIRDKPKIVLLCMDKVPYMDVTGVSYFSEVIRSIQRYSGTVLIAGIKPQPRELLVKSGLYEQLQFRFFQDAEAALDHVYAHLLPAENDTAPESGRGQFAASLEQRN